MKITLRNILGALALSIGLVGSVSAQGVNRMSPLGPGPHRLGAGPTHGVTSQALDKTQISAILTANQKRYGKGNHSKLAGQSALVLYDSGGPYGFVGVVYGQMMVNYLSHFHVATTLLPVEQYTTGLMNANTATFYLGTTYENVLPSAFTTDAMASTKPLCWCGYNIWKIAWTPDYSAYSQAFLTKYGFSFNYMDGLTYTKVTYNGVALAADPYGTGLANISIYNSKIAKVVCRASTGSSTNPYLIHASNLWFFGENPLQDSSVNVTAGRTCVLFDSIHDILGDGVTTASHYAVLRIEDVHANSDPVNLRALADVLYAAGVPYVVCVIPHYRDPLGVYNGGDPVDMTINDSPDVLSALQYMASKGGQIILEGDTHQYDDVKNALSGVSGEDYEFYRFIQDPNNPGNDNPMGPTFEDSTAWAHGRIQEALSIASVAGFTPIGWLTPHYFASPVDYTEFAQDFKFKVGRGKVFSTDTNGNSYFIEQMTPWPILDSFGMATMPEDIGYVSTQQYGVTGQLPKNLIAVAKKLLVVRDGWAGMYFHPFLAPSLLKTLVTGIKGLGYTFVMPSDTLVK